MKIMQLKFGYEDK